jgi:hypothetical protein
MSGVTAQRLPCDPTTAFALAMLYQRLGGSLTITSSGRRGYCQPLPDVLNELPQLPDAAPDERFHSAEEWSGAIKLVRGLLKRLDDADSDLVFGALATEAIDPRKLTPSIEEPRMWRVP